MPEVHKVARSKHCCEENECKSSKRYRRKHSYHVTPPARRRLRAIRACHCTANTHRQGMIQTVRPSGSSVRSATARAPRQGTAASTLSPGNVAEHGTLDAQSSRPRTPSPQEGSVPRSPSTPAGNPNRAIQTHDSPFRSQPFHRRQQYHDSRASGADENNAKARSIPLLSQLSEAT